MPNHVHALAAARAAEAAGLQGRFWEMHDTIYEHQADWKEVFDARPIFEGYAKTIGLDLEQFNRDVNNEIVQRRIDQTASALTAGRARNSHCLFEWPRSTFSIPGTG